MKLDIFKDSHYSVLDFAFVQSKSDVHHLDKNFGVVFESEVRNFIDKIKKMQLKKWKKFKNEAA